MNTQTDFIHRWKISEFIVEQLLLIIILFNRSTGEEFKITGFYPIQHSFRVVPNNITVRTNLVTLQPDDHAGCFWATPVMNFTGSAHFLLDGNVTCSFGDYPFSDYTINSRRTVRIKTVFTVSFWDLAGVFQSDTSQYILYDCDVMEACTPCTKFVPCQWSVVTARCQDEGFFESEDVYPPELYPLLTNESECGHVIEPIRPRDFLIPSGTIRSLGVLFQYEYRYIDDSACRFIIDGRTEFTKGNISPAPGHLDDYIGRVVCGAHKFQYDNHSPEIVAKMDFMIDRGLFIENNVANVTVYKCEYLGDTCSKCSQLDEAYDCVWCDDTRSCLYAQSEDTNCKSFINSTSQCPDPSGPVRLFKSATGVTAGVLFILILTIIVVILEKRRRKKNRFPIFNDNIQPDDSAEGPCRGVCVTGDVNHWLENHCHCSVVGSSDYDVMSLRTNERPDIIDLEMLANASIISGDRESNASLLVNN